MGSDLRLSVVIPARNEEGCVRGTVMGIAERLLQEAISFEVLVVDDNSTDGMGRI